MTLSAIVGVETGFSFMVTEQDGSTPYTGLTDSNFDKYFFAGSSSSSVTGAVTELGNGVYWLAFTPNVSETWLVQIEVDVTGDWIGEYFQVLDRSLGSEVAEAQMNAAYDDDLSTLMLEVWLDRDGASVVTSDLVSCSVTLYDVSGSPVFTEASSSPKSDGHFSLSKAINLLPNKPYNAEVTVTDSVGVVTTYQAFTTLE